VAAVLIFSCLVPFGVAVSSLLRWPSTDQETAIALAESLTDPAKDPVYATAGLVPTRVLVDQRIIELTGTLPGSFRTPVAGARNLLTAHPAAVFIPSPGTDRLSKTDHDFIRERYVPLADDLWVLGKVLPPGGGFFNIVHPGRYRVSTLKGSDLMGTYPAGWEGLRTPEDPGRLTCLLDGRRASDGVVGLGEGRHQIQTDTDCQVAVVWVGPRLDRIHRVPQRDHRYLFAHGY
jgi:hypothetical protein